MNDVILKADNLFYSYDDGNTFPLNGLSLKSPRKKNRGHGAKRLREIYLFPLLQRHPPPGAGDAVFSRRACGLLPQGTAPAAAKRGYRFPGSRQSAVFRQRLSGNILRTPQSGIPEEEARQEVERIMEEMDITPYRDRPTHALSGGQKKQVSIADILVMKPEIVILDEPTAAWIPCIQLWSTRQLTV